MNYLKTLLFSIFILFFSCTENKSIREIKQTATKTNEQESNWSEPDTSFIQYSTSVRSAQSIYFDKDKNSRFYDSITSFTDFSSENYAYSIKYLQKDNTNLRIKTPIISLIKWVSLKQFVNRFYAYKPCDSYFSYKASFSDSTFIDWTGEGAVANKIITQRKIDDKTYSFELTGINQRNRELIIHIIDQQKGIAVFEEITNKTDASYHLMIAADKIKSVALIINNCEIEKQLELEFDEIDYAELLR